MLFRSQENIDKIMSLKNIKDCEIKFVKVDDSQFEMYKNIKTHQYVTLQTYYRLKLAQILPEVDRIIYMDCDMVVNDDLEEDGFEGWELRFHPCCFLFV